MKIWKYIISSLLLAAVTIWLAVWQFGDKNLHLIACDVGQGDAILATYGSTQILTDGGPNNKVVDCLSRHMPFWDRKIELVILTHPQLDHYGGLAEVFGRYKVENFLYNPIYISSSSYEVLKKAVGGSGTKLLTPKEGLVMRLDLIQLDVLNPTEELKNSLTAKTDGDILGVNTTNSDLNDFSIVYKLSLGNFDALLTGDIDAKSLDIPALSASIGALEYLKVPHHGSRNGLTKELLDVVNPKIAVISVGRNNRYGHPHEEVLKMLNEKGVKILRTDEIGDVEVITDGQMWREED